MKLLLTVYALLLSSTICAGPLNQEINFLKNYIQNSPCQFNRNGDTHSAPEALQHINKKYEYFKDDITSAEQFIEKSASKSTLSGKPYTVICPPSDKQDGHGQQTLSSKTWLLRALADYRNQIQ
jgi:hypothetical protein